MALYSISVRKAINTNGVVYKWSNRYYGQVTSTFQALELGQAIWESGERLFHNALAFCYEIYVNNMEDPPFTPGTTGAIPVGIQRGARTAIATDTTQLLPSFNVLRVDFPVVASRPSRKFYRIPLLESDMTSANISTALGSSLQAGVNAIAAFPLIRDPDNQGYSSVGIYKGVTSRRIGREAAVAVPGGPPFG